MPIVHSFSSVEFLRRGRIRREPPFSKVPRMSAVETARSIGRALVEPLPPADGSIMDLGAPPPDRGRSRPWPTTRPERKVAQL